MKKKAKEVKEQKVTLDDIHEKVIIVVDNTSLMLSQQNEISKAGNIISDKHNELLQELKVEIQHGNESRTKQNESINEQTKVLSLMTGVLGKVTENNTSERLAQNSSNSKSLLYVFILAIGAMLLIANIITIQDVKELKKTGISVEFSKENKE